MKNITSLLAASLATLLLSACSGGGGDASFENGESVISLVGVDCVEPANLANYETLLSGDTVVKDDANATVIIYHDVNGVKKICLVDNGSSAHIVR